VPLKISEWPDYRVAAKVSTESDARGGKGAACRPIFALDAAKTPLAKRPLTSKIGASGGALPALIPNTTLLRFNVTTPLGMITGTPCAAAPGERQDATNQRNHSCVPRNRSRLGFL
jgi:hypothetical protein